MWASLASSLTAARSTLAPRRHQGKAATETQRAQRRLFWRGHRGTETTESREKASSAPPQSRGDHRTCLTREQPQSASSVLPVSLPRPERWFSVLSAPLWPIFFVPS